MKENRRLILLIGGTLNERKLTAKLIDGEGTLDDRKLTAKFIDGEVR